MEPASNNFFPEDLNSPSTLFLTLLAFRGFLFTNPTLNNEHIVFITSPLISEIDYLLDIYLNFSVSEFLANTVLYIPLVFAHDIFVYEDVLDSSKSLLFFSNSAHLNFFINFSVIDNRLLFLKFENFFFSSFIYNYSFNFSYISVLSRITSGVINFDVLYILRLFTLLVVVLTLLIFANVKYVNQLNIYFISFYKYFYSKTYQLGMDYRFTMFAFTLLFSY